MSRLFLSNLPEQLNEHELELFLLQIGVIGVTVGSTAFIKSQSYKKSKNAVIAFDTKEACEIARAQIPLFQLHYRDDDYQVKARPYIPNIQEEFKTDRAIVVLNLPLEVQENDVSDLFAEFGEIVSCAINFNKQRTAQHASVLFKQKEDALQAMMKTDGQYLGENQIKVEPYKTPMERSSQQRDILVQNIPIDWSEVDLKDFLGSKYTSFIQDKITLINGKGQNACKKQAIFSCSSSEQAELLVRQFEGVPNEYEIKVMLKKTGAQLASERAKKVKMVALK